MLGWLTAIPAVGALVIPYFAVVFANGGREPVPLADSGRTSRICPSGIVPPPDTGPAAPAAVTGSASGSRLRTLATAELRLLSGRCGTTGAPRIRRAWSSRNGAARHQCRVQNGDSGPGLASLDPRFASNPLLTHMGEVRCNMLTGALVPRRGTVAGVPGPRRSADECDAGWFAPVATRRRSMSGAFGPADRGLAVLPQGETPWNPHPNPAHLPWDFTGGPLPRPAGPRSLGVERLLGLAELGDRDRPS